MKKIYLLLFFLLQIIISTKINVNDKIKFCFLYPIHLFYIYLFNPAIKTTLFLDGRRFFFIGSHINLVLDHIHASLGSYYATNKNIETVFDIGASFGVFSLMLHYLYPKVKIYAFEPGKENFHFLSKNCHNVTNINLFNVAIGEKKDKVDFFFDKNYPEGSKIGKVKNDKTYIVQQLSLNDFVKDHKIRKISLMKIDVEGYEYNVLKGASKILKKVKILIIETDLAKLTNIIQILILLNKYKFNLVSIGDINYSNKEYHRIDSFDLIFTK